MTRGRIATWVRAHQVWTLVIVIVVLAGIVGAVQGGKHSGARASSPAPKVTGTASAAQVKAQRYARHLDRLVARQKARDAAKALRQANQPRLVEYYLKGTTGNATVTYTSTGGGTVQRDIGVLPEWRSGKARLRPGDFAQMSVQLGGNGSVTCKIVEHTPYGIKVVAPPTTSSGSYVIADCNGTVH